MKKLFTIIFFMLLLSVPSFSCTMEASFWNRIESNTYNSKPQTYAITDALYVLRNKFEREMIACKLATGPVCLTGVFYNNISAKNNNELYEAAKLAVEIIWPNVIIASASEMPEFVEDYEQIEQLSKKYPEAYSVTLNCSNANETLMNLLDFNPQFFEYLKFVYREELKVGIRIADGSGLPVYLDEIEVSPTIIIQPYLTPIGGFIYVFEKNNTISVQVSFGTLAQDGAGEHQMLILFGNNQETLIPPYDEFKSDLEKRVEKEHNQFGNLEFYKQLMMEYEKEEKISSENKSEIKETNEKQLMFAIKNLDKNMLKNFIEADNSGVNCFDESGYTPLILACKSSFSDMVRVILENGGNPKISSNDGKTALHHAVDIGTLCLQSPGGDESIKACPLSIPELLINAGADINAKDKLGKTPLHYAVHNGLIGVASSLIKVGADVNAQDNDGNTPMHSFGKQMSAACVQVLLSQGAKLDIKNNAGLTPYEKAMKEANASVVNAINDFKESKAQKKEN